MYEKDVANRTTDPHRPAKGARNGLRNINAHIPNVVTSDFEKSY